MQIWLAGHVTPMQGSAKEGQTGSDQSLSGLGYTHDSPVNPKPPKARVSLGMAKEESWKKRGLPGACQIRGMPHRQTLTPPKQGSAWEEGKAHDEAS